MCLLSIGQGDGPGSALAAFGLLMTAALTLFVACVLLVFLLKRLLGWMDARGWITYTSDVPTYGTLANAFLDLQSLSQPQMHYVLEAKQDQEVKKEEDDEAGPDDPGGSEA